jgi:hypothetical protein
MKSLLPLAFAAALAAASPVSLAADPAQHDEHHPDTPAAKKVPNKAKKAPATPTASAMQMGNMDAQMKAMRDMHEKMMAAKTPEERDALMAEHMKTMQNGMSMMNGMMGGMMGGSSSNAQPMSPQMMQKQIDTMQKQMEMMQTMMQMMMDRMGPPTPAK